MRLRKVKNALDKLIADEKYFILNPEDHREQWNSLFQTKNQLLHIEIGCGKGRFVTEMAKRNPEINFIGIERFDSVLVRTSELAQTMNLPNLKLILLDAQYIENIFAKQEVNLIYINFSDPWMKKKYHKRRLTAPDFLMKYHMILKSDGSVFQKTDNRSLFAYSLEMFCNEGWLLSNINLDLHKDEEIDNVRTEFEEKWSLLGPIYRLEARKRKEE